MPNENAEAGGGWTKEGRTGPTIDENKMAAFLREMDSASSDGRGSCPSDVGFKDFVGG